MSSKQQNRKRQNSLRYFMILYDYYDDLLTTVEANEIGSSLYQK
jgi:hypothetical protein